VLFGVSAYVIWGMAPAYWKAVQDYPTLELTAHRVLWSGVLAVLLLALTGGFRVLRRVAVSPRHVLPVAGASLLLGVNWLVFIYAVSTDRIIATSLGYYLNPLLSVVLGMVVLGERLRPAQWLAVGIAALGVGLYILALGELPWIAVALALSFGLYGLIRKTTPVDPIVGFGIEMAVLSIPCAALVVGLSLSGRAELPTGHLGMDALIAGSGLLTAAPLLCFNAAAKRLLLVTVGMLQYIAPSMALVLAVVAYHEPFERVHALTFGCVWLALGIFTVESLWNARGRRAADAPKALAGV
jgi:chloramphenicol-sensitive protein RarD